MTPLTKVDFPLCYFVSFVVNAFGCGCFALCKNFQPRPIWAPSCPDVVSDCSLITVISCVENAAYASLDSRKSLKLNALPGNRLFLAFPPPNGKTDCSILEQPWVIDTKALRRKEISTSWHVAH